MNDYQDEQTAKTIKDKRRGREPQAGGAAHASTLPVSPTTTRAACTAPGSTPTKPRRSWSAPSRRCWSARPFREPRSGRSTTTTASACCDIDEFESLAAVAKVAKGIAEHGPAFAAWAAHVGTDSERLDEFEDAYMGEWESAAAFAEEMLEDMGHIEEIMRGVPEHLAPYVQIDYEGFARDLVRNGELATLEKPDGGIYVFRNW